MPFFRTDDDIRIFYRDEGRREDTAIIFSNSLGSDHMMWQPQAAAFAARYRIIRYDQRGHGASDVPPGEYTLDRLGRDIVNLADHLDLDRFVFCGLSMGGLSGQWLGVHAGHRLQRLILADTSVNFPPATMWHERMAAIRAGGLAAVAGQVIDRFFTKRFQDAEPGVVAAFRSVLLHMNETGYLGCSAAVRDGDMSQAIARIETPTLVITGEHDLSTPPERGDFIAARISGARHVILDAAHIANVEQSEAFNRVMGEFLTA